MSMTRRILAIATCTTLLAACGSEYQPYTSAPEPPTPPLEALLVRAGPNSTGSGTVAGSGIDCAISGATFANTCAASLARGKVVTLTAGATGGSTFLAWGDACASSGASPTCVVTVSEALAVSASFSAPPAPPPPPPPPPPPTYVVTMSAAAGSTGTGAVTGNGINCTISGTSATGDCSEELAQGAQLTITQAAADGGSFLGWGGACASAASASSCTITISQATSVEAGFALPPTPPPPPPPPPPTHTVTIRAGASSGGTGTVSGTGISCSITTSSQAGDCSETFVEGTQLTLAAAATGGGSFAGWGGACAAAGTSATCVLTVSQNMSVDASFAPPPPRYVVSVAAGSTGTGTGTVTGPGISCTVSAASQSGDCSEELVQGTQLVVTSAATGGSTFAGWGGACSQSGTAASCTITVTQTTTVTASFTAPPPPDVAGFWSGTDAGTNIHYHITLAQSGATLSLPTCAAGNCRLSALSSTGSGWLGAGYLDIVSLTGTVSTASITFTMNLGDRTVKFEGALTSPTRMVGQVSGPTMPAQSLTIDRQ